MGKRAKKIRALINLKQEDYMHIDYANEVLDYVKKQYDIHNWGEFGDKMEYFFYTRMFGTKEFTKFMIENCEGLTLEIAKTLQSNIGKKYSKPTEKQRYVCIKYVMENFKVEDVILKMCTKKGA